MDTKQASAELISIQAARITEMENQLSASEALYGFMGWLTCTDRFTDCALAADLVSAFCKVNNLDEPRPGWNKRFVYPDYPAPNPAMSVYTEPVAGKN